MFGVAAEKNQSTIKFKGEYYDISEATVYKYDSEFQRLTVSSMEKVCTGDNVNCINMMIQLQILLLLNEDMIFW